MRDFKEYEEAFKVKLVKRYNWSVTDAGNFSSAKLRQAFDEQLSLEDAFCKVFDQKLNITSEVIGKPV